MRVTRKKSKQRIIGVIDVIQPQYCLKRHDHLCNTLHFWLRIRRLTYLDGLLMGFKGGHRADFSTTRYEESGASDLEEEEDSEDEAPVEGT